jgi:hypothetical protein
MVMKLFKKDQEQVKGSNIGRISRMETESLKTWFDNTLMGLGPSFDQWRYHGAPDGEVSEHIHILNELWSELQQRTQVQ